MFLRGSARTDAVDRLSGVTRTGQKDLKFSPFARHAHKIDRAAVISNDPFNDGETHATTREFSAEERIEDFGLHLFRHSATRIRNLQVQIISRRQVRGTVRT